MEINTLFSILCCASILVAPSTCDTRTIRDFTNDKDMVDTRCNNENYTSYCTDVIGNCKKGTHIMCTTYRTGMLMGNQCVGGAMFKMHQGIKDTITNEIEGVRKEAFKGLAQGKDDRFLPRAWGLHKKLKLSWDSDLAMFAQVWTNQCQKKRDFCRDSKKFKDVDQFVGVDFFTRKEWQTIRLKDDRIKDMKEKCLTTAKIKAAIKYMIELIKIDYKEHTTEALIKKFDGKRNTYLTLLNEKTTHIGCGMSYYLDYKWFKDTEQKREVFALQLVCNIAHKPLKGAAVYSVIQPVELVEPTITLKPVVSKEKGLRGMDAGPGFVIMPIIKAEDAPLALTAQRTGVSTFRPSLESIASRKSNIFLNSPIFNIASRNHGNASNGIIENKISLNKKLNTLLEQPRRDMPQLRELLKQIVKNHESEEHQISRIEPVEKLDTVVSEPQEHVMSKPHDVPLNIVNDDTLTNDNFKNVNHGINSFIGDLDNLAVNTNIFNNEDTIKELDVQTPFHIPKYRKLKPVVHVKKDDKFKNSYHENTLNAFDGYSAEQKQQNDKLVKNEAEKLDYINDNTNMGRNIKPFSDAEGNNMKLKSRIHLENEISQLKRKVHNLRQYIRENDANGNFRARPMVTSHIGPQTSMVDKRRNFYMPDRSHSLHEF